MSDSRYREAANALLEILRADPNRVEAYCLLADAEVRLGEFGRAALALGKAGSLAPTDATIAARSASVFALRGRWSGAIKTYRRAIELGSDNAETFARLAMAQMAAQKISDASESGRTLRQRFPNDPQTPLTEALLHKALGRFDAAVKAFERSVELAPDSSAAWYGLIELATPRPDDERGRRVATLCAQAVTDYDRANLGFSMARIYEGCGDFERAFDQYRTANEATQRCQAQVGLRYVPAEAETETASIMARHPRALFASASSLETPRVSALSAPRPTSDAPIRPIFVVGLPRSGTTLVEQILSSHPRVSAGGELTGIPLAQEDFLWRRGERGRPHTTALDPSNVVDATLLSEMRERYIEDLFARGLDNEFVTDKFPGNFQNLGFIRLLFPHAIIVHCRRKPIATCWSLFCANLAIHAPYYSSLDHLAHFYIEYRKLMAHWRLAFVADPILEVDYEDLVDRPETAIRRLLDGCGLPWDPQCLAHSGNPRAVTTASALQVRQPLYRSSLERWKPYAAHLGALLVLPDD